MPASRQTDPEANIAAASSTDIPFRRYRDDSDDESSTGPDAPLRSSVDIDDPATRPSRPAWLTRLLPRGSERLESAWQSVVTWVKGPQPPRIFVIDPLFPRIQHAPLKLLDRYAPKRIHRFGLLIALYACWLLVFSIFLWKSSIAAEIPGHGSPINLNCETRYWSDGNSCGLNGDQCRPFANSTLAFRCPADCKKTLLLNPHAVGDQEVNYKPLVVGGPADQQTGFEGLIVENAVYRGDSFICASAVHAGFIKDSVGGCGVLRLTGEQPQFSANRRHSIESTGFDSYFPQSFGFLSGSRTECRDLRWSALVPSVFFTALLSLFTTDPAIHFWSIFVALFFHVALVSDPPALASYYDLLSLAFARFLPACFCMWVSYRYAVRRSLLGLTAQIEKTVLWVGAAWVGSLNNYTFDRIPIQRLTPHDIQAQPGAVPALISILLIILCIALGQAWSFRLEGRMPRYLLIYGLMVAALLIMIIMPGLNLRIHHYILGLLFLPGTSFQNRPSLLYQGLLVGLFINGVARWGFASILETPAALLKDAQQDSLLPVIAVLAAAKKHITFDLGSLPIFDSALGKTYDGVSILVNDVERFRGYVDDSSFWSDGAANGSDYTWTWTRHGAGPDALGEGVLDPATSPGNDTEIAASKRFREYFRFAYMAGNQIADFTNAGVWDTDGSWVDMQPGPSSISDE